MMGQILTVAEHSKMIAASFYLFLVSCSIPVAAVGPRTYTEVRLPLPQAPKRSDVFQTSIFNLGTSAR